jgi:hypothetical protein
MFYQDLMEVSHDIIADLAASSSQEVGSAECSHTF